MNILFYYSSNIIPTEGGVQRVTDILAKYFKVAGHNVFFMSSSPSDKAIEHQFNLPNLERLDDSQNTLYIGKFVVDNKIDAIINQDGLNPAQCRFVEKAIPSGTKLITVCHNAPLGAIKNFTLVRGEFIKRLHLPFLLPFLNIGIVKSFMQWGYKCWYYSHYRRIVGASDIVVLLSNSYKADLRYIVGSKTDLSNVIAIPNPCTIEKRTVDIKEKVVLSVGRISFPQKRNDLLLRVWSKIEHSIPDWKLKILGDGPDLDKLKTLAEELQLKRVEFVGFSNPLDYYKASSVLCMTSAFEGFPLVLAEAMTNGLVPIGFGSYSAIYDIINDGQDGFIIKPFEIDEYSEKLLKLLQTPSMLNTMSKNAEEQADKFSLEEIGNKWFEILK